MFELVGWDLYSGVTSIPASRVHTWSVFDVAWLLWYNSGSLYLLSPIIITTKYCNHVACRVFTNMLVCSPVRCVLRYKCFLQGASIDIKVVLNAVPCNNLDIVSGSLHGNKWYSSEKRNDSTNLLLSYAGCSARSFSSQSVNVTILIRPNSSTFCSSEYLSLEEFAEVAWDQYGEPIMQALHWNLCLEFITFRPTLHWSISKTSRYIHSLQTSLLQSAMVISLHPHTCVLVHSAHN